MGFYPNADHLRAVLAPVGRFLKICRFIWACCCAGSPLNIQHPPPHPTFRNLSRGFRKGNQSEQRLHSRGDEDEPLALWGRSRKTLFWMHILLVDFLGAACQQVNSRSSAYGYIVSKWDRQPIKLPFPTFMLST